MKNKYMMLLIALTCSACAMPVGPDKSSEQSSNSAPGIQVNTNKFSPKRNENCSSDLYLKINGQWYYRPGSCPLQPSAVNYPDPAGQLPNPKQVITSPAMHTSPVSK